ncbi:MAG TPA: hypothetical protein VMJ10_14425 [Kofleriaceae bacterium]|nr:hypothetical protein [Kofleriaceae bacterium]
MTSQTFRTCLVMLVVARGTIALAAPPPGVSPSLFDRGNLRLAVACADEPIVTPELGLHVSLDGQPIDALGTNLQAFESTDDEGNLVVGSVATSVGFLAAPGHHHLRIETPDCAADDRDLDLAGAYPERVLGRLAISNPALQGPTGAPNGFAFMIGGYATGNTGSETGTTGSGELSGSYTLAPAAMQGVWLGLGAERRHLALWADDKLGWNTMSGSLNWSGAVPFGGTPGPFPFTRNQFEDDTAIRIGARAPLGYAAVAAGAGIGMRFDMTTSSQTPSGAEITPLPPDGLDFSWYVPLWAAVTLKASCDWGVQAVAAYDIDPTDSASSRVEVLAGLEYQPSDACNEAPYVVVKP